MNAGFSYQVCGEDDSVLREFGPEAEAVDAVIPRNCECLLIGIVS